MNYKLRKLVMIAIAYSFAAASTTHADGFSSTRSVAPGGAALTDNARLSIRRAADFGFNISVILFIDGVQVAVIGFNQSYDATVRPGHHVLGVATTPNPYGTALFDSKNVTMKPGQIYTFTALWGDTLHATLELPDAAVVRVTHNS